MADELDELFTVDPENFTATRDALVKRLRADKRRDEAALVAKLKRPVAVVWAMNQVARAHPELIDELRDLGAAAYQAQEQLLSGGPALALHDAVERRRSVVGVLMNATIAMLASKGVSTASLTLPIRVAFETASIDAGLGETLRGGVLTGLPVAPDDPEPARFAVPIPAPETQDPGSTSPPVPGTAALSFSPPTVRHLHVVPEPAEASDQSDELLARQKRERELLDADHLEAARVEAERLEKERLARVEDLRFAADVARVASAEATNELAGIADSLATAKSSAEFAVSEIRALTNETREARRQIDALERSLAELVERLQVAEANRITATARCNTLEDNYVNATERSASAATELARAEATYADALLGDTTEIPGSTSTP